MVGKLAVNSSISNSDRTYAAAATFVRWGIARIAMVIATFVVLIVMGEIYMRVFFLPSIFYEPDSEIKYTYRPNHQSITWQGHYSVPSPPMSFNSDGHRGTDTDWNKRIFLALGSSEVVGPGIGDHETWADQLEQLLRKDGDEPVEVVNAGIEGHGPFHHAIVLDRVIDAHKVDTVVIRASVGDRNFAPPTAGEASKSALRQFLRDDTRSIRFLVNKSQAQIQTIRKATVPFPLRRDKVRKDKQFLEAAKKMWTAYKPYWKQAVESADQHDVRLVFLVINANGWEGDSYLARQLRYLGKDVANVSVLELGPEVFGLEDIPLADGEREKKFNNELTLAADPHGNPKQHRIIADTLYKYLTDKQAP